MGEMADWYDDMCLMWDNMEDGEDGGWPYPTPPTCRTCKKVLKWRYWERGIYRLWDPDTESYHKCKAEDVFSKFKEVK